MTELHNYVDYNHARQLSKSLTVVIQPLSTRFMKPNFCDKHCLQFSGYPFLDTFFLRCDWTRPNQNKTRLAEGDCDQPNPNDDKKVFV